MDDFAAALTKLWPHGDQHITGLVSGLIAAAPAIFPKYGIDGNQTIAHAMAQFSHECAAGLEMVENMNYSAAGLQRTWPTRFGADRANRYAHNPQMIADSVYGGRMGNAPPPSHDGWNFRGRGLSQVTGREGYDKLAQATGLDLTNQPDLVNDPGHALECGVADFIICKCLDPAKADNVKEVTHRLNGGYIGLAERIAWLRRWKQELGI